MKFTSTEMIDLSSPALARLLAAGREGRGRRFEFLEKD